MDSLSFIPIINTLYPSLPSKESLFEFGLSGTDVFVKKFKHVTSIETQNRDTFDEVNKRHYSNLKLYCALGEKPGVDLLRRQKQKFSCIFVKGHGGNRWECINESFNKTDIIITHDTETVGYNWHLVNKPPHFIWIDIKHYNPWTSVITCNKDLVRTIVQLFPSHTLR